MNWRAVHPEKSMLSFLIKSGRHFADLLLVWCFVMRIRRALQRRVAETHQDGVCTHAKWILHLDMQRILVRGPMSGECRDGRTEGDDQARSNLPEFSWGNSHLVPIAYLGEADELSTFTSTQLLVAFNHKTPQGRVSRHTSINKVMQKLLDHWWCVQPALSRVIAETESHTGPHHVCVHTQFDTHAHNTGVRPPSPQTKHVPLCTRNAHPTFQFRTQHWFWSGSTGRHVPLEMSIEWHNSRATHDYENLCPNAMCWTRRKKLSGVALSCFLHKGLDKKTPLIEHLTCSGKHLLSLWLKHSTLRNSWLRLNCTQYWNDTKLRLSTKKQE